MMWLYILGTIFFLFLCYNTLIFLLKKNSFFMLSQQKVFYRIMTFIFSPIYILVYIYNKLKK